MNEAQAIREMPRTRERVWGELLAAYKNREVAMKLVGECAAMDLRPFYIIGDQIVYTRELNIPDNIKQFANDAALAVAVLERELYDVTRSEHSREV